MGTSGDKIVLLDGMGSVSVASVTSTKVPNRICAGDAGVVTTEEQTPMTRIISGI